MKKNIKLFSLIMNVIAIVVISAILIGSTFAWFTDSTVSYGNKVQAGTLKVDLEVLDVEDGWTSLKENNQAIFDYDRWEPGYTDVKILKVENEGSLALQWKAKFISNSTLSKLANVIDVYVLPSANELTSPTDRSLDGYARVGTVAEFVNTIQVTTRGTLLGNESAYLGLALKMRDVGNEYQGLSLGGEFDIQIEAVQLSYESDSFGNDYDSSVVLDKVVASGTNGGAIWSLNEVGELTISPSQTAGVDPNCGKVFEAGMWRESVVYNSAGTGVAIGGDPYDMKSVKSLVIEEGITYIGSFAAKFPNLTGEVVIPSTVTYIGQETFQGVPITKLTFAEGGTEELCIGPGALKGLQITEVAFPADRPAIHIHCWAFNDCKKLETVTIPANVTTFANWTHVDYMGLNYIKTYDSQIFARCNALKTMIFGSQQVHDLFFNSSGNRSNINAIGNVQIIVQGA